MRPGRTRSTGSWPAFCTAGARGGGQGKQVTEVTERAGEHIPPCFARSTDFLRAIRKTAIAKQIGTLITGTAAAVRRGR